MADIFEKKLLLLGKQNKNYKAYLLFGNTVIDVSTLGFTEPIDPETTKGTSFDCVGSNYVILNGKLYYCSSQSSLQRVGNLTNWTDVTGYYLSSSTNYYAYGIAGGKLYRIGSASATQVGSLTTWTKVSGFHRVPSSGTYYCPYGIAEGKLYYIKDTSTTRVGSLTTWTDISGLYCSGTTSSTRYSAYGVAGNVVYRVTTGTSTVGLPTINNFCKIGGYAIGTTESTSSTNACCIVDGKLYELVSANSQQIGTGTNWTDVSGFSKTNSAKALGIRNGILYTIVRTIVTQVGNLTNWTKISGYVDYSGYIGYGIAGGNLYELSWSGSSSSTSIAVTDLSLAKCIAIYGTSIANYPALAICEQ